VPVVLKVLVPEALVLVVPDVHKPLLGATNFDVLVLECAPDVGLVRAGLP